MSVFDKHIDKLTIGDIVGEMHLHQVNSGPCKGWDVKNMFAINNEMFDVMFAQLNTGEPASGKLGYMVSAIFDFDDDSIESVLVIYKYDTACICATLVRPTSSISHL